jgi:hypothetical protein
MQACNDYTHRVIFIKFAPFVDAVPVGAHPGREQAK